MKRMVIVVALAMAASVHPCATYAETVDFAKAKNTELIQYRQIFIIFFILSLCECRAEGMESGCRSR